MGELVLIAFLLVNEGTRHLFQLVSGTVQEFHGQVCIGQIPDGRQPTDHPMQFLIRYGHVVFPLVKDADCFLLNNRTNSRILESYTISLRHGHVLGTFFQDMLLLLHRLLLDGRGGTSWLRRATVLLVNSI